MKLAIQGSLMGLNLNTANSVKKWVECAGTKYIPATKRFAGSFKPVKLGKGSFLSIDVPKKYFWVDTPSKVDKKLFRDMFIDSVIDFEAERQKCQSSFIGRQRVNLTRKIMNLIFRWGAAKEIVKDSTGKLIGGFCTVDELANLHIQQLVIDPSRRNKKETKEILTEIGKKVKEFAQKSNSETITCDVVKGEKHLIRLYKKVGFAETFYSASDGLLRLQAKVKDFGKGYF